MRKKNDPGPHLDIPPSLQRSLRVANICGCVAAAGVTAALGWIWMHPAPHIELPIPVSVYWVPVPPIHTPRLLVAAMGAAFASVVVGHLDLAYPLVRWVAPKFGQSALASHHWVWGIFASALRQSTMRAACLIAGVVGLSLWHYGQDGLDGLEAAMPFLWTLVVMLPAFVLLVSFRRAWRVGLSAAFDLLQFQIAIAVAQWALNST